MKLKSQNIVWFGNPPKQEKLTASLGKDMKLRISDDLRKKLSSNIQFGFLQDARMLIIRDTDNQAFKKHKANTIYDLGEEFEKTELKLPVRFEFRYDSQENLWCGSVILDRKKNGYDMEQVLALYKPLITKLCNRIGKTTPLEDRRQIISLAFCEASQTYLPAYGDFKKYLENHAKALIKSPNHLYVKENNNLSMDKSLTNDENSNFNLYSVMRYNDINYSKIDDKIMNEQFQNGLTEQELTVYQMLCKKIDIQEISEHLDIPNEKVEFLAKVVAMKRKKFYSVG